MASDKKKKPTSKVVATAVSVAAGVVFSAGAVSLAQGSTQFDPGNFVSAYAHGDDGSDKGYRASRSDVDAQANRHSNESEDDSRSTSNQMLEDAFSQMPLAGDSGTTAYRVSSDAPQDNRVSAGTASGGGTTANGGDGNVVVGPVVPGNGNAGDANNGNGNGNGTGNDPSEPSTPDSPGTPDTPDNPSQPETPWVNPLPNDPTPSKDQIGGSLYTELPVDGMAPSYNALNTPPHLMVLPYSGFDSVFSSLYVGQKLDAWSVFCAISVGYNDPDDPWILHSWTCNRSEFLYSDPQNPKAGGYMYFRIVDYPDVVPDGGFTIKYQYRFNAHDEWADGELEYDSPAASRVYVMSGAKNADGSPNVLYALSPGDMNFNNNTAFLPSFSAKAMAEMGYIAKNELGYVDIPPEGVSISKLMLGWTIDGKPAEYFCKVDSGRHVIEPGKIVDVPNGFSVLMRSLFIDESSHPVWGLGGKLGYFQTLASADDSVVKNGKLVVPDGIEAVRAVGSGINADTLVLPASAFYIDTSSSALHINNAYQVAEGNPVYSATADGVLTDKTGTVYEAIPTGWGSLVVPGSVAKVNLSPSNKLKTIEFEAKSVDALPQIDLSALDSCCLVADDDVFDAFVLAKYDELIDTDLTVAKASDKTAAYSVKTAMLCQGTDLVRVIDEKVSASSKTLVANGVNCFKAGAFRGSQNAETVVLGDGDYVLEDGCFAGGNVSRVICKTEEQLEYVGSRLEAAGANEGATAVLSEQNDEGFSWITEVDTDGYEVVTLLGAPDDLEYYDGCLTRNDAPDDCIVPDVISARAFANHANLKWVTLRQGTSQIGEAAFEGCSKLESLFIEGSGDISVGKDAIAGCTGLRFVASNAMHANFESSENPSGCAMYCLEGAEGYDTSVFYPMPSAWGSELQLSEQSNGARILYAYEAKSGGKWLAMAADASVPSEVVLPASTQEIYCGCFASIATSFTVNWGDLSALHTVDGSGYNYLIGVQYKGAFQDSGLQGDAAVAPDYFGPYDPETDEGANVTVGDQAFANCTGLTSFTAGAAYETKLGLSSFAGCSSLASFSMGADNIYWGEFSDCDNLKKVTLAGDSAPELNAYTADKPIPFSFKGSSLDDDIASGLKVEVSSDEVKNRVIDAWTYPFAGYFSLSPYDDMYDNVKAELATKLQRKPEHLEVIDEMSKQLLTAENKVRDLLGMEHATEPRVLSSETTEDGFKFVDVGSEVQLVGAPADLEVADLSLIVPDKYKGKSIVICSDAFKGCADLREVRISSNVGAIETNAFAGCDKLEKIVFPDGSNRLKFDATVYSFTGKPLAEEAQTLKLEGLGDDSAQLLQKWVYWFYGSNSSYGMRQSANDSLKTELGRTPYAYEVYERVRDLTAPIENNLRVMMGLPSVEVPSAWEVKVVNGCWLLSSWSGTTFIKAPDGLTTVDLGALISDLALDPSDVTVAKGAFAGCSGLKTIELSDKIGRLESGAFVGCDGVEVRLPAVLDKPGICFDREWDEETWESSFSWGSKVSFVAPDEVSKQAYLKWWPRYSNGYNDESYLYDMAFDYILWETASLQNLNEVMNSPFFAFENELRGLMGLPEVDKLEDAASFYDAVADLYAHGDIEDADQAGDDSGDDESGASSDAESQAAKAAAESTGLEDAGAAEAVTTKPADNGVEADASKSEAASADSDSGNAASNVKSER